MLKWLKKAARSVVKNLAATKEPVGKPIKRECDNCIQDRTYSGNSNFKRVEFSAAEIDVPTFNRLGDYELIGELGRGGFGVVYEARHLTSNQQVALKNWPFVLEERWFRRSFDILRKINHPNLVRMLHLEVNHDYRFLTMELVEGEDFLSYVSPDGICNETRLRASLAQLVKGLLALHKNGVVHRFIKSTNILVEKSGRLVIIDFDLIYSIDSAFEIIEMPTNFISGCPMLAAPESLVGKIGESNDWFSVGCLLCESLTGERPFIRRDNSDLSTRLKNRKDNREFYEVPKLSGRPGMPDDLAYLSDAMLRINPNERADGKVVAKALGIEPD